MEIIKQNLLILFILFLACLVYSPGLSGPLIIDDYSNLYALHLYGEGYISWLKVFELSPHGSDRPVTMLTFIANWMVTGDNIWYLKATNLLIHLICALLVYKICQLILIQAHFIRDQDVGKVAAGIMAVWILSPFLLTTVLYVVQRMAQLSALFTLCGILVYLKGRLAYNINKKRGYIYAAVFIVCWLLAFFSKQNGILLPVLCLLIEFLLNKGIKGPGRRNNVIFFLFSLNIIILLLILSILLINPGIVFNGYQIRDFTLFERLLTQQRVLLDYTGNLLLIPGMSPMSLFHDDYIKSSGLISPASTLLACVLWILVFILFFKLSNDIARFLLFGLVFFYTAHLVEASIIPLELYFEHRNYLPSLGVYFSFVTAVYVLIKDIKFKKILVMIFIVFPLSSSVLTYQRASTWSSSIKIFLMSELTHPNSPRVNEGLAVVSILNQDTNSAIKYLNKTDHLKKSAHKPEFYIKYLLAYCDGKADMPDRIYRNIDSIDNISDSLTTINYFSLFIDKVEDKKCDTLNLYRIATSLSKIVKASVVARQGANDIRYELMARVWQYLGNDEELEFYREKLIDVKSVDSKDIPYRRNDLIY